VQRIFWKQVEESRRADGVVDLDLLARLVISAYARFGDKNTGQAMASTIDELDALNRDLERTVANRTRELAERESELRAQNIHFHAAIDNMSQGLLLLDAQGRVLICNERYRDLYKLKAGDTRPGIPLAELLRNRARLGTFAGDPEKHAAALLAQFAAGHIGSRTLDIGDGRTIAISNRIMPGAGWVSTHEDITERQRSERQIVHMAHHDALTDLPNRTRLREHLARELRTVKRGQAVAVHYLDLDHFKTVNDTLGHPIGDELLRNVADRLRACVRDTEFVARVGGDEFAIVQRSIESPKQAGALARRVRDTLSEPYDIQGHVAVVNASVGIAVAPGDGNAPDVLIKNADMALYRAKGEGRGTYRFFAPEMDARMQQRRALELALRDGLAQGQFELYYQPVLDAASGTIVSCEALIRWHHPDRGMIAPAEFIPVAEEIGLIVPLGDWVLRRACEDAAAWPDRIKIAINLSPTQIASRNLVPSVVQTLAAARLNPSRLTVEITEAVLLRNSEATVATLYQLRSLGIQIALDDFGTGFSSLSYLRSFPFDKLKIDRCFIAGLADSAEDVSIVRAVTGLARSLRMTTTAEGVETGQQLAQVRDLGCTEMQGNLFSPPLPVRDVVRFIATGNGRRDVA
jgi:diguanylate cyclase (GGDEF)-like protein